MSGHAITAAKEKLSALYAHELQWVVYLASLLTSDEFLDWLEFFSISE